MSLTSDFPVDLVHIGIVLLLYWHEVPLILLATHEAPLCWLYCSTAATLSARADSSARTVLL